jgi:hypothetical protein
MKMRVRWSDCRWRFRPVDVCADGARVVGFEMGSTPDRSHTGLGISQCPREPRVGTGWSIGDEEEKQGETRSV